LYFCFKQACLRSSCPPLFTQSCETQSTEYRKQKTKISITPQQDWAWNLVKKIHWLIVVTSKYVPLVVLFAVDVKAERAGCAIIPFLLFDVIHNDKTTANAIAQTRIPTSRPWKNVDVQHCLISSRDNILQNSKIKALVYQINRYLLCHWLVTHRSPLFWSRGPGLLLIVAEVWGCRVSSSSTSQSLQGRCIALDAFVVVIDLCQQTCRQVCSLSVL
jgi:hypothetical protein